MWSKPGSVALSILAAGAAACAAASCSNSTSGGPSDSGTESGSSGGSASSGGSGSSSGFQGGSSSSSSSSGGSSSSSGGTDAGDAGGGSTCTGTASEALIDDMSAPTGTAIALKPPMCAQKGTWFNYPGSGGGMINPSPFAFSMLPAPLPADASVPDAGSTQVGDGGDGGASGPRAACISGATGTMAYSSTGMGFNLATTPNPDGGFSNPVAIDAHAYTGIQFWGWGGAVDGGGATQLVTIQAYDKNETPGFGVCDPTASAGTACGASQIPKMFAAGWQFFTVPFASFAANPGYGDANETSLDPASLTKIQWQVQLASPDGGTAVPFDFCVYDVSFY